MIEPKCDKCKLKLNDYGAVVWSPPNSKAQCKKYHICKPCWKDIMKFVTQMRKMKLI